MTPRPNALQTIALNGSEIWVKEGLYRERIQLREGVSLYGGFSLRVIKGLSLNLNGSYARIRDQLSLQAAGLSDDEILLRLRQLATGYRYGLFFGVSYRFGSMLNNIVNPRFEGTGNQMFFF